MDVHTDRVSHEMVDTSLQRASVVQFLVDSCYGVHFEYGVVLRFVHGYSKGELSKVIARQMKRFPDPVKRVEEEYVRFAHGRTPLRELDTHPYALILFFNYDINDYVMMWVRTEEMKAISQKELHLKGVLRNRSKRKSPRPYLESSDAHAKTQSDVKRAMKKAFEIIRQERHLRAFAFSQPIKNIS